jgi:endo-1,3-1,4-beta-glycanase ExoK
MFVATSGAWFISVGAIKISKLVGVFYMMNKPGSPTGLRLRRIIFGCVSAVSYTCAVASGHAETESGGAFFEGFDQLSANRWLVSDGWTNGPHQNCTWSRSAVSLSDGSLNLAFKPTENSTLNLCGELQSRAVFSYGTFEARLRTPQGSGLNAAFFTYIGPTSKKPHDEIDFEVLTKDTSHVSLNTFVDGKPQNGAVVPVVPNTSTDFHTYAFEWSPDQLQWFVDGRLVHSATTSLPVNPQKIFLSFWGSDTLSDWMGPFVRPDQPLIMQVDWVAFTPLGSPCAFPDSILCHPQ